MPSFNYWVYLSLSKIKDFRKCQNNVHDSFSFINKDCKLNIKILQKALILLILIIQAVVLPTQFGLRADIYLRIFLKCSLPANGRIKIVTWCHLCVSLAASSISFFLNMMSNLTPHQTNYLSFEGVVAVTIKPPSPWK